MSTTKRLFTLTIALCCLAIPALAQDALPTPNAPFTLQVGVPLEANLNASNVQDRYTFDAPEGANITLEMIATSGTLDSALRLLNTEGLVAESNVLQQGDPNARVEVTDAPGGTYIVEASRFGGVEGDTSGTYQLTLTIAGLDTENGDPDALPEEPPYSVDPVVLDLENAVQARDVGSVDAVNPQTYFALVGNPGDLLTVTTVATAPDLTLSIRIVNPTLATISETIQPRPTEVLAYATLLERAWYLVEVTRVSGEGTFSLFANRIAGQVVDFESREPLLGEFTPSTPGSSFIMNGKLGDVITISVIGRDGTQPEIRLLDVRQREVASDRADSIALVQAELPRSGTYVIQVNNVNPQAAGAFSVRVSANEADINEFETTEAAYNRAYKGDITSSRPYELYTFEGSAGELVTAEMNAAKGGLDPFLLIMDSALNELVTNDNARDGTDARIIQFALPDDGTYYLLAGRSDLAFGSTVGSYNLALSAGSIATEPGVVMLELQWQGDDDLNLFVREPTGRVIGWANPNPPRSATLQVDSNTNCETISAEPVEYIYWETPPINDDYEVWVWYQNTCEGAGSVVFELTVSHAFGEEITVVAQEQGLLTPGQRYELDMRVSDPDVFVLGEGRVSLPSPQQRVSEGGDVPVRYGSQVSGRLDNEVYARFYQFQGRAGDEIVVEVEASTGDLDPLLILRDDTERNVVPAADDISEANRNARLETTLPNDGRYVIAVTRFGVQEGLTTGNYTLSLERSPVSVAEGEAEIDDEAETEITP